MCAYMFAYAHLHACVYALDIKDRNRPHHREEKHCEHVVLSFWVRI